MHSNDGNSTLHVKDGDMNKKLYLNLISKHSETHDTQKQILSILKEFPKLPVKEKNENLSVKSNILDGCYHVYLDIGSNIGIQVRKLFEPEKYPEAAALSIYDALFKSIEYRKKENHSGGKRVCAVGFEPNPAHTKYLEEVETSYNKCGYKIKFFTETAASHRNGEATFYSDENFKKLEWGGSILSPDVKKNSKQPKNMTASKITVMRLSEFLKSVVGQRKLPRTVDKNDLPRVLMKMDIEGSEIDVIPDVIFTGGLQYVNKLMIEWHSRNEKQEGRKETHNHLHDVTVALSKYSQIMQKESGHFDFDLIDLDDETYGTTKLSLPQC